MCVAMFIDGNGILNVFVSLCFLYTFVCQPCEQNNNNSTATTPSDFPEDWPCAWKNGTIPFVFNFFSVSPKRLVNLVAKGHEFLQERSCLQFKEHDPILLGSSTNTTYLYYTYSGVLESCCLKFYSQPVGRRVVLITPTCTLPAEVAHATLHGLGLQHWKTSGFHEGQAKSVIFPVDCKNKTKKLDIYGSF